MTTEPFHTRPYRDDDLGLVLGLWEREGLLPVGPDGLEVDTATDLLTAPETEVVVAERDDDLVGMAAGSFGGGVGFVFRVVGEDDEVSRRLLDDLERRLARRGARKLTALVEEQAPLRRRLADHGYRPVDGRVAVERDVPSAITQPDEVSEVGGEIIEPGLWDGLQGVDDVKRLIEHRIILPLAEPEMAARHAVTSPRAVVLFGPPGTGKTTFAQGIASRLQWPFVQIEPSELVKDGADQETRHLAQIFARLRELLSVVAFIDEVEAIASVRADHRRVSTRVTTEFLRQLPRLRESPHHLVVCATNWVSRLDPAFLRPGRFDSILPVGPPDETARAAIWRRYVEEITDQDIDFDALVRASQRFTPADIEFAARKGAQQAFEREYFDRSRHRAVTEDFLAAIEQTRPSLTVEMIERFERDREEFARY